MTTPITDDDSKPLGPPKICLLCLQPIELGERYRTGLFDPTDIEHIQCGEGVLPDDDTERG